MDMDKYFFEYLGFGILLFAVFIYRAIAIRMKNGEKAELGFVLLLVLGFMTMGIPHIMQ